MNQVHSLWHGLFVIAITCGILYACIYYLDEPLVYWAYETHLREFSWLNGFVLIADYLKKSLLFLYPLLVIRFIQNRFTPLDKILLYLVNSIAIAEFLKSLLKPMFGRTWPATWKCHNLSLIENHIDKFDWLHGGMINDAFPSGHMVTITAAMTALAIIYPKMRIISFIISTFVAIGLVGLYYHYLSDIIAGALLGYLTAYYTAYLSHMKSP